MSAVKHVITGGPCTGKTTTVEALRQRGFSIIQEASRILIEDAQREGTDLVPWKRLFDFNVSVTKLQMRLESQAKKGVHFLDRGIIDNLAYCEWGKIQPPRELEEAIKNAKYGKVFLLLPLENFENDVVRKESKQDALTLTKLIKKHYKRHGYEVLDVPPFPVNERVEFILKNVATHFSVR